MTAPVESPLESPLETKPEAASALRRLLIKGSAFEMVGMATSQAIRLGSNLVLSRLLYPQAFGIMAIVNIVNQGLVMFSDAGLHAAVIQSERGEDPHFLNTIFTWQAMRGFVLWFAACLLSIPFAVFYGEPSLRVLMPAGSLAVVILGFHSTAMFTLRRRLSLLPLVLLDVGGQILGVVVMVTWAKLNRSPWALIGGLLSSAVLTTVVSHFLRVGYRNRFEWHKPSAQAMFEFGKWIAGSSMLTFASQQGDRLMLGHFLGTSALGVYSIAVFLSGALGEIISRIASGVLFPAYSRVRAEGHERLRDMYYKTRLATDGLAMPALGALCVLGKILVGFLYDHRYVEAGWMLQVLTVRVALAAIVSPCQFCLFALGRTRDGFSTNLVRVVWLATAVPAGYHFFGVPGLVWAAALCEVPALLVLLPAFTRAGLLRPMRELLAPVLFAGGMLIGLGLRQALYAFGLAH